MREGESLQTGCCKRIHHENAHQKVTCTVELLDCTKTLCNEKRTRSAEIFLLIWYLRFGCIGGKALVTSWTPERVQMANHRMEETCSCRVVRKRRSDVSRIERKAIPCPVLHPIGTGWRAAVLVAVC